MMIQSSSKTIRRLYPTASIRRNTSGTTQRSCLVARPRYSSSSKSWANRVRMTAFASSGRIGPDGLSVSQVRTESSFSRPAAICIEPLPSCSTPERDPTGFPFALCAKCCSGSALAPSIKTATELDCRTPPGTASSRTSRTAADEPPHPQAVARAVAVSISSNPHPHLHPPRITGEARPARLSGKRYGNCDRVRATNMCELARRFSPIRARVKGAARVHRRLSAARRLRPPGSRMHDHRVTTRSRALHWAPSGWWRGANAGQTWVPDRRR